MRGRGSQDTRARSALAYAKIVAMMMRIMRRNLRKMTTGMIEDGPCLDQDHHHDNDDVEKL